MSILRSFPLLVISLTFGVAVGCAKGTTSQPADVKEEARSGDPLQSSTCGDLICGIDETCASCSGDCGECEEICGDDNCGPVEDCGSCPADCGPCGVASATTGVTSGAGGSGFGGGYGVGGAGGGFNPMCGDSYCDPPETTQTCPQDCQQNGGTCVHDVCQVGPPLTPTCDACANTVCGFDPYCCDVDWDGACVDAADFFCGCS